MKRIAWAIIAALAAAVLAAPAVAAHSKEFKVIQNAVRPAPAADMEKGRGREVRWLKVLIRDSEGEAAEIRLSLPIALIEVVLAGGEGRHFKVDDDHCEIDLRAVWRALKKAGPHALVEIRDDGAVFKVWIE